MADTYRNHLLNRVMGGAGRPAVGPVADLAANAARETAYKIALALKTKAPPGIGYTGGGAPVAANDILGQRGPVVVGPQYRTQPPVGPIQPQTNTGSPQFTQFGSSDTIMTVPSGGYEALGVNPAIVAQAAVPGALAPVAGPTSDTNLLDTITRAATRAGGYLANTAPTITLPGVAGGQPTTFTPGSAAETAENIQTGLGLARDDPRYLANKTAEAIMVNAMARPTQYAAEHVPYGEKIQAGFQWPFNKAAHSASTNMYKAAMTGQIPVFGENTWNPAEVAAWEHYADAQIWSLDPKNKPAIQLAFETGLDINQDGVIDVKGPEAVWMLFQAENHPGFIDQLIGQMGMDPLFYIPALTGGAAAGRESAQVAAELARIGGLSRAERILNAVDVGLSGVTKAGELGGRVADLPFTLPAWMLRKAGEVPAVRRFARPATWLFEPSETTKARLRTNEAADIGGAPLSGGPPDIYEPTPGVTQAPWTPPGSAAVVERPIDPTTGAPVGTFLTDQPVRPREEPPPGGGVGVAEGPIRPRPTEPTATEQLQRDYEEMLRATESYTNPYVVENVVPPDHPTDVPVRKSTPLGVPTADIGLNGEVRVITRDDGVFEVQTNRKGKWVGEKGFSGADAETEAIDYGKSIVRGGTPLIPEAEPVRVTTVRPKVKRTEEIVTPEPEAVVPEPVVVRTTPDDVEPVGTKPPTTASWSVSSKNRPEGMVAQLERDYPDQWEAVKTQMAERTAAYEAEMNRANPSTEPLLRTRKNNDAAYADQKIVKAEFYADLKDQMRAQGIPVDELVNEPGINRNPTEGWVGEAIYGDDITARGARAKLASKGYVLNPATVAKELPAKLDNIRNHSLPPTNITVEGVKTHYPDGSLSYEREGGGTVKNMTNKALEKMTPEGREAVAAEVARDYEVRAHRYERIQAVRNRFHPPGTQPGGGVVVQDLLAAPGALYDRAMGALTETPSAPIIPEAELARRVTDPGFRSYESDQVTRFVKWGDLGEEQAAYLKSVVGEGDQTAWDILADIIDKHMRPC